MSTPVAALWNVEGHNCCFWAKNSDRISQVGYVGAVVASALAIITILGGVLILLGQQGYPLGAINAIAHKIPSSWIYTSWFVASTLFLFCVGFLTTINQKTRDQIYTPEEIGKMGLLKNIEATIPMPMEPKRYTIFISPGHDVGDTDQFQPAVYAIMKRDNGNAQSLVAYKTEEALSSYINNMHLKGYQQQDEHLWESRESYTLEAVSDVIESDKLERACARLERDLKNGFYNWEEIYAKGWGVNCLLYAWKEMGETRFIIRPYDAHPGKKGEEYFPGLIDYRLALQEVEKERSHHLNRSLIENDYSLYPVYLGEKTIYAVVFKRYSGITIETEFFIDTQERGKRLEELAFEQTGSFNAE